jgi:hypothetical protein
MRPFRPTPALLVLLAAGCAAPAPTPPGTPAPVPTIVVTYPSPLAPDATASAPIAATPTPEPSPARVESASFFFVPPAGWAVTQRAESPERVTLGAADGRSSFVVATDPNQSDLAKRRATAVSEAGSGIVSNTSATIDQLTGYYITSNRDTEEGKRYVAEYGFAYRGRVFTLRASWDKREANAEAIATDIQTIIRSFKWL